MELEKEVEKFLEEHTQRIRPLFKKSSLAWWNAYISGKDQDYQKYSDFNFELGKIYKEKENFEKVKYFKSKFKKPVLKRQVDILYLYYLENQIDLKLLKQINDKGTEIEKKFNTFRAKIDGKEVTKNEIERILENEKDNNLRKKAWEAGNQVGEILSEDLIELVKLKNKAAQKNGFNDYYEMNLFLQEQDKGELIDLLDKAEKLTRELYRKLKEKIDHALKKKYNTNKIFPWYYSGPFLEKVPKSYEIDLDKYYQDKDILEITKNFYKGIGFDISNILNKSDLYEKPKKNPHAWCRIIDRETKDVRVLMNVKNNCKWMSTSLHEFGHGIYFENHDSELPFLLKRFSHSLLTEGISMMFGDLVREPSWIENMIGIKLSNQEKKEIEEISIADHIIFLRWVLVMFHFEKSLYENPNQDLNSLWWNLREKYQLDPKPEGRNKPDYAAKTHFTSAPIYYHNYLLGLFFASQLKNYITKEVLGGDKAWYKSRKTGEYLREKIFKPGLLYNWNDLIKNVTGEKLKVDYFINELN